MKPKSSPDTTDDRALHWSISRLSAELQLARETIAKRLAAAHVPASGRRQGYATYRLRDAVPAIFQPIANGGVDPRELTPQLRDAWYRSEARRLEVETMAGQLVDAEEARKEYAKLATIIVQFLVTLPDFLELNAGLLPYQIEEMHRRINDQREALASQIREDAADESEEKPA